MNGECRLNCATGGQSKQPQINFCLYFICHELSEFFGFIFGLIRVVRDKYHLGYSNFFSSASSSSTFSRRLE
jgi:hypothetical protein